MTAKKANNTFSSVKQKYLNERKYLLELVNPEYTNTNAPEKKKHGNKNTTTKNAKPPALIKVYILCSLYIYLLKFHSQIIMGTLCIFGPIIFAFKVVSHGTKFIYIQINKYKWGDMVKVAKRVGVGEEKWERVCFNLWPCIEFRTLDDISNSYL